jgi:hypothetical protein
MLSNQKREKRRAGGQQAAQCCSSGSEFHGHDVLLCVSSIHFFRRYFPTFSSLPLTIRSENSPRPSCQGHTGQRVYPAIDQKLNASTVALGRLAVTDASGLTEPAMSYPQGDVYNEKRSSRLHLKGESSPSHRSLEVALD